MKLVTPPNFAPREIHSPSALSLHRECPQAWGGAYLRGLREPEVAYEDLPPPPAKPPKGASAVEKAKRKAELKAYNKRMRPALGKAVHAIFEAYYKAKAPAGPGREHAKPEKPLDLDAAWHTRPGQIALSGRVHLPNPEDLAAAWVEELVHVEAVPGWTADLGPFPPLGGTPDLVTCEVTPEFGDEPWVAVVEFHLYDHKTTVAFDWAKTEAELLEDEQANLYGLAVMQRHGLSELACTWVYYRTDAEEAPASMPVHFHLTRAHAEAVVLRMAKQAAELERVQQRFLAEKPGLLGKRLQIVKELATNDIACDNFGGCLRHVKRGGDCKPKKSSFGEGLRKQGAKDKKFKGRRDAAKLAREKEREGKIMALNTEQAARLAELEGMADRKFAQNQELAKLKKLAAADGGAAPSKPDEVEASGEEAPAEESKQAEAPKEEKPATPSAKPKASKPAAAPTEGITVLVDGFSFHVPAGTMLGKQLAKAAKALQAAASAFEGE